MPQSPKGNHRVLGTGSIQIQTSSIFFAITLAKACRLPYDKIGNLKADISFIFSKFDKTNSTIMVTKAKVLETVGTMPEEFNIDELIERLLFIQKVEKGLEQSKKNEIISMEELKKRFRNIL
jgi:hypothetical protein